MKMLLCLLQKRNGLKNENACIHSHEEFGKVSPPHETDIFLGLPISYIVLIIFSLVRYKILSPGTSPTVHLVSIYLHRSYCYIFFWKCGPLFDNIAYLISWILEFRMAFKLWNYCNVAVSCDEISVLLMFYRVLMMEPCCGEN